MNKFKIEITENGASIKTNTVETVYDADGENPREILGANHRTAIGVGDLAVDPTSPTSQEVAEFHNRVNGVVSSKLGVEFGDVIAGLIVPREEIDVEKAGRQNERKSKEALEAEVAELKAEVAELKAEISSPKNGV